MAAVTSVSVFLQFFFPPESCRFSNFKKTLEFFFKKFIFHSKLESQQGQCRCKNAFSVVVQLHQKPLIIVFVDFFISHRHLTAITPPHSLTVLSPVIPPSPQATRTRSTFEALLFRHCSVFVRHKLLSFRTHTTSSVCHYCIHRHFHHLFLACKVSFQHFSRHASAFTRARERCSHR